MLQFNHRLTLRSEEILDKMGKLGKYLEIVCYIIWYFLELIFFLFTQNHKYIQKSFFCQI